MPTITIKQMKELVKEAVIKRNMRYIFIGEPGCGKTEGVKQASEEMDAVLLGMQMTTKGPVDVRGVCDRKQIEYRVGKALKTMEMTGWLPPEDMPVVGNPLFPDDKLIVMFLDELLSNEKNMMPIIMQMLLESAVGGKPLKPNVRIVGATNDATHRATSKPMPSTVSSRALLAHIRTDMHVWADHFETNGGTPMARAFYSFKDKLFSTFNPADKTQLSFACPRTNSLMWSIWQNPDLEDWMKEVMMKGAVGDGVATEAIAFTKAWKRIIKPSDILKDPEGIAIPVEADIRWATAANVSGLMTYKNADTFAKYLKRHRSKYAEIEAMAWTLAMNRTDKTANDVCKSDAYAEWAREVGYVYLGKE
jgi:hypothetical protein